MKDISKITTKVATTTSFPPSISQNLTLVNFTEMKYKINKYIVIHYTANNGDTAKGNTDYFKSKDRGSSANYFVDEYSPIWQCVEDNQMSWAVGDGGSHPKIPCYNCNSISIELCSRIDSNGNYYFLQRTIENAAWLTLKLMNKYGIPLKNVVRHYDVSGKLCPRPFLSNSAWNAFKDLIISLGEKNGDELTVTQYEELKNKIDEQNKELDELKQKLATYQYIDDNSAKISPDANEALSAAVKAGILAYSNEGFVPGLTKDMIRMIIYMYRLGFIK